MTKDEALKLALELLKSAHVATDLVWKQHDAVEAIKEALAQSEQEPVAWMNDSTPSGIFARHKEGAKNFGCTIPLYTTPPQHTWVGLTNDEIYKIHIESGGYVLNGWEYERAIESALREKNGG